MKSEKIINDWKDQRSQIEIGQNFTDQVMNQVYQHEQTKPKPLFDMQRLVELISGHPLVKIGLVAGGAITGFVRLVFMIIVILSKGEING